ncbi:phage virion morphogenesis protein [Endozoicomonas sp. SM1973]|uniref:Phage virion morphogenesis protein n=1 Tax=Spartinivicinus marinus TaxID=2994442 RepID=A0A853IIS7_9GAMM|nr:phage virion morphogenesis protein [Spartinivicinus marinus]MCX4025051.1 phage virion morphogenesis protein [Spartinivicinus marinus]NYZ68995.1 phage virion morphogenesis protein [Spartinivicinus marinus]
MAGAGLDINLRGIDRLNQLIERLQVLGTDNSEILDVLGALAEDQIRRRIEEEQTAPDGTPWPEWSSGYSTTRHSNQGLLQSEGHLLDSINYVVGIDDVTVETNLLYAAIHQYGGIIKPKNGRFLAFQLGSQTVFAKEVTIPARPFMGLSDDNQDEIEQVLVDWVESLV